MSVTHKSEREKYERMYSHPDYHVISPGLNIAPIAFKEIGAKKGDTIRDYGCGTGRAVDWFSRHGLIASGVDIAPQRDDILQVCLWELPGDFEATDFAFCCDVLEHLPEDRMDAAISGIKNLTKNTGFFTIATINDNLGAMFGEVTHLTVKPLAWWVDKFRYVWGSDLKVSQGDRIWRHNIVARR